MKKINVCGLEAALVVPAVAGGAPLSGPASAEGPPWGVIWSDEDAARAGIGGAEGPSLSGEWSRVDACAGLAWDVEFLVGDVSNFMLQRTLGTHREYADDPLMAGVLEMVRERVKWSFYAAKGLEKALPVLCRDVQYEDKAGELVLETLRQALK